MGSITPERGEDGYDRAKEALAERISGRDIYICTVKAARSDRELRGGFGRYLATIWHKGENVNEWMLAESLAVPYE